MNLNTIFICDTDTVCGLGGPINDNTLKTIFELKQRPLNKKIMILVGSIEQAKQFKEWNNEATEWAKQYWPGAFSIIVNNQGFRMPKCSQLCQFLINNGPMYVTSANISGYLPIELSEAEKIFPQVKNIYSFNCQKTNQASAIYHLETKKWIR